MAAFKYQSFIKNVMSDLGKADRELRRKAGRHLVRKIRSKINKVGATVGGPPGRVTGTLLKGLGMRNFRTVAVVGFKAPAYHANILEFGKSDRTAHPVLFSTFAEEANAISKILWGERLK